MKSFNVCHLQALRKCLSSALFLACICLGRICLIQTRPKQATANVPHYQLAAATQPSETINLPSIQIQAAFEELQTCLTHSLGDRLAEKEEYSPATGVCENQLPHLFEFILPHAPAHTSTHTCDLKKDWCHDTHSSQNTAISTNYSLIYFLFIVLKSPIARLL